MSVALIRLDDRLIHGQVVVGWGQPLDCGRIVLVDDEVRASDWEQDLYRMGVPPHIEVVFASIAEAVQAFAAWLSDSRPTIVLVGDLDSAGALFAQVPGARRLNVGGLHHRAGRTERLRYVYLTDAEAAKLRAIASRGIDVTAQDVPTAAPVPLEAFT